ncbi:MAG TPA: insulinase family protein [Kofleriaceae bacterium]|nr:insulinase family protein [Kofleriaceae bacterium]
MLSRLAVLALAALVACGGAPPAPAPVTPPARAVVAPPPSTDPDDAPLPLWPEVKKGVLPSGLTYYILKHGKPEKRAMLWLAVDAGSVQEDDDQRGLAHFDEHMAFNGTKRFPKLAIVDYLEKIGMRFGADLNAETQYDNTIFELEVPTDQAGFVDKGLDILRDWAGDVTYDPVEVDKERGVVLEEWRLGRGADARLFDKHAKVLFEGSRYATRTVIGDPEIIKHATRDTLYRFYKDWYRPDLLAVIVVGDVDPVEIERQIQAKFGDLKAPARERPRPDGGVPPATGTRVSIATDREATETSIMVANLAPHRSNASKRDYRRLVTEQLYTTILNERLSSLARRPDAPFSDAAGLFQSITRDIDAFERGAQVKGGKVEDALRAMLTEVARIERHGVTASELERARTNLASVMSEAAATEATTDSRDFTEEITRNFFAHELMIGRVAERNLTLALLPTITMADLDALARPFSGADSRVILISAPDPAKGGPALPDRARVLAIVDEVSKAKLEPWQDVVPQHPLMAGPPATPGKIVHEDALHAIGAEVWTLSNGLRVVFKPTDYEKDSVVIAGIAPGGEAMASDKDYPSDRFANDLATLGGMGDYDVETLTKMLAGKQVQIESGIDDTVETIDAGGSAKDLETLFQLVYLRMTAPRKDEQAFGVWKTNAVEQLTNAERSPEVRFARDVADTEYKHNPRRTLPEPGDIAKIDLDKALAFYKDRFADASEFTFVIVGAVDPVKTREFVTSYLGALPSRGRKESERDLHIRKVPGVVKSVTRVGEEQKASVQLDFHGDETWTRDKERDIFVLGQVLSIKLREVMREDLGGVYNVGAAGDIERSPHQERSFEIQFGCDPKRVDELIAAAFGEIGKLAKDGATADDLDKVKQTFLRTRETQLRNNLFWAGWLINARRYGDDPAIILDTSKMTARMTAANVKAAARRFLDAKQYFQAELLPAK